MLPKLIAVDMDGTFLDDHKDYDRQRFARLMPQLQARGIYFVVASGNQYYQLRSFFTDHPNVWYLAENGAYCATATEKTFSHTFAPTTARKVLDKLLAIPELKLTICAEQSAYIRQREGAAFIAETQHYYTRLQPVADFDRLPDDPILKFASNFPPELTETMVARIAADCQGLAVPTSSGHGDIDIIQPGVNKASGLRQLGEILNIELAEMAAFGDGGNDLEMLQEVGLGVAMANAQPEVAAIADAHAGDNNHAGVIAFIENLLKQA